MMDARGIAKSLVVTVPAKGERAASEGDRQKIIDAVRAHPGRLFLMDGGATLKPFIEAIDSDAVTPAIRADFEKKAEAVLASGAIGFGEMILMHFCLGERHSYQSTPPDHPLFFVLADVAARRNVPIDVHMEVVASEMATPANLRSACSKNPERLPASLPGFERLLNHNRKARIVWQHIGWDNSGQMTVALLRELLGNHPNLYLSLRVEKREDQVGSKGALMPNRIVDESGDIKEEWLALIREFPDRFMIGADEFVGSKGGLTTEPIASFQQTWSMFDRMPADLKVKIGRENAARVYRLK